MAQQRSGDRFPKSIVDAYDRWVTSRAEEDLAEFIRILRAKRDLLAQGISSPSIRRAVHLRFSLAAESPDFQRLLSELPDLPEEHAGQGSKAGNVGTQHGPGASSRTRHPHTGHYGVSCPYCGIRPVATAKKLWFIYGLIIFTRCGSQTVVGCEECARSQTLRQLLINTLAGWWCIPWGALTPFVILQNLFEAVRPQNRVLVEELLRQSGIDPSDVRLDSDGLTGEQRKLLNAAFAVLGSTIFADGQAHPREMARAIEMLNDLAGGRIAESQMRASLLDPGLRTLNLSGLSHDYRVALLHMSLDILCCDGSFPDVEVGFYYSIAQRLGINQDFAKRVLEEAFANSSHLRSSDSNPEIRRACGLLGISSDATILEIKKAYRQMMLRYHPDKAGNSPETQREYTARAQEINWAYEFMSARAEGSSVQAGAGQQ